jgi:predicted signal transduction protein with EAL and GGDEF domain
VAERLRVQVESMPGVPGGPKQVTLSVGSTVFDPQKHHESAADLMRRADSALYAAKRAGRNRVVVLMPGAPLQKIDPAVSAMSSPPAPEIRVLSATGFGEKA